MSKGRQRQGGRLLARSVVLRGMLARRHAEALLGAVIAALAAGLLLAGVVAEFAQSASLGRQVARLRAPGLIATVQAGDASSVRSGARTIGGVSRVGQPMSTADGAIRGAGADAPAQVVAVRGALPAWLDLVAGRSPGAGGPAAVVERGAVAALGLRVGSMFTLSGPTGTTRVRLDGVVGDLSRASYPLTALAGVYVNQAAASAAGVPAGGRVVFGVWLSQGANPRTVAEDLSRLVPADHAAGVAGIGNSAQAVSLISTVATGAVLALGLVALLGLCVFLVGNARIEVLRRERWIGELRATGWTPGQIRLLLVVAAWPWLGAGALAGAGAGTPAGLALAGQVSRLYGAEPATPPLLPLVVADWLLVLAMSSLAVWFVSRRIGWMSPASQLAGASESRRRPGGRVPELRRGGAPLRLAATMAASRRARTLIAMALVTAATVAAIFAVAISATLNRFTSDPSQWGLNFQLRADLPTGVSATAASGQIAGTPGVAAAVPVLEGATGLAGHPDTVPFALLPAVQSVITPRVLNGRMPRSAREVALGAGLASALGARPGTVLRLEPSGTRVTVVGITQEIENQGDIMRGTLGLADVLRQRIGGSAVLIRVGRGTSVAAVRQRVERASGGRWALTTVLAQISLPFAATIRAALTALAGALLLLAAAMAGRIALITSEENLPTYGLLKALGARPRQLTVLTLYYTAALVGPGLAAGIALGVPAARTGIAAISSSVGGIAPDLPLPLTVAAVVVAALAPAVGVALPVLRGARRAPAATLRVQV